MRVIQVNKFHYLRGGSERYYLDVSAALAARGHEVQFLSMRHARNLPASTSDQFVSEVDYRARMSLLQKGRAALRTVWNFEAARKARRLARDGERAIAHLHNFSHQLTGSIVRAFRKARTPIVQTLHDYKPVCPNSVMMTQGQICSRCQGGRFYEAVKHRCLLDSRAASFVGMSEAYLTRLLRLNHKIDLYLCPSKFLLETMADLGLPREKLLHFPYFLPAENYLPAVAAADEPVCVYVGRLSREKGIATLIQAMARLPKGRLSLHVLGEGPLRAELEDLVARTCADRVKFLGYRSGSELHDTIRNAAFSVVPSEWYENLPFAVLETFALGRPVVGAKIGGIPELVVTGETGRIFTSGSVDELTDALLWMSEPATDLLAMGRNARLRIERQHAPDEHLDKLEAIYRGLLDIH